MILEYLEKELEFTIKLDWKEIIKYNKNANNTTNKEFSFSEDLDSFSQDKLKSKASQFKDIKDFRRYIKSLFEKEISPIVYSVFSNFSDYNIAQEYGSNYNGSKSKGVISLAYYYHTHRDIMLNNVSFDLNRILSHFVIRFANHISDREKRDLFNLAIVQKLHIRIPNETKEFIRSCVFNILEFHTDVLGYIENHPKQTFDTFENLGTKFVNKLKELQKQGDFSDQF